MQPNYEHINHRLHDTLVDLLFDSGPQNVEWLTRRARRDLRDARIDEEAVVRTIEVSTLLVPRPDGAVVHALAVLEGNVLTHRVRAPLTGRRDLWLGPGLQPLLNIASFRPIPLVGGNGAVVRAEGGHDALIGPDGWLPAVNRFELIGLRISDQKLEVAPVAEAALATPEKQARVRRFIGDLYTRERYWYGTDDSLHTRPAEIARAINTALLEDPELFASPYPPLDELLHDPLERASDVDIWREIAASQQAETVSFSIARMPYALERELAHRAKAYGMTRDQFVIALLSTLAWRTPFAEDMEPWDNWDPERKAELRVLSDVEREG